MKNLVLASVLVIASVSGASAFNGHENWAWTQAPTAFSEPNYVAVEAAAKRTFNRTERAAFRRAVSPAQ